MKIVLATFAILAVSVMTASVSHAWSYDNVDSASRYRYKVASQNNDYTKRYRVRARKVELKSGTTIRQFQTQKQRRWQ